MQCVWTLVAAVNWNLSAGLYESNYLFFFHLVFQEVDPYQQLEALKANKTDLLRKVAALKQQILDIETQENEAIHEVSLSTLFAIFRQTLRKKAFENIVWKKENAS